MRLSPEHRYIIGATVDSNAPTHGDDLLEAIFIGFMHTACNTSLGAPENPRDIEVIIWRETEGDAPAPYEIGSAVVMPMSLGQLEKLVGVYEHGFNPLNIATSKLNLFFAIGSSTFCQAFIHLMATTDEYMAGSWGLHYLRKLATAERGDAFWYDTATPEDYFHATIEQLIKNFTDAAENG